MNERKTYPGQSVVRGDGGYWWALLYRDPDPDNVDRLDFRGPTQTSEEAAEEDLRRWLRTHGWGLPEGWE